MRPQPQPLRSHSDAQLRCQTLLEDQQAGLMMHRESTNLFSIGATFVTILCLSKEYGTLCTCSHWFTYIHTLTDAGQGIVIGIVTNILADPQRSVATHVILKADTADWYLFRVHQVKPLLGSNLILEVLISSNTHLHPAALAATGHWGRRSVVMHGRAGTAWLQATIRCMLYWHAWCCMRSWWIYLQILVC